MGLSSHKTFSFKSASLACDWPCNWLKWGLPGKCLHNNAGALGRVRPTVRLCERDNCTHAKGGRGELIAWFFCHARLEKNREAERFEVSHHVKHKHILLEFTFLLFRFGCTCTNCFQEELLGIDAVNSAGASVGKACIHCVCMLGFPRFQGKYCDLIKWIVIRIPP